MSAMPTFPSYHGPPLPRRLNPLKPSHYLMLVHWIWLKPSRLRQYLHRTAPEIFEQRGLRPSLATWRNPALRNLYLMAPVCALFLSLLLIPTIWLGSVIGHITFIPWVVIFFIMLGLAFIPAFFVVSVALGMVHGGVAWGAALAVTGTAVYPFVIGVVFYELVYLIGGSLDAPAILLGSLLVGLVSSTVACTVYGVPMGWQATLVFALIAGVGLGLAYDATFGDLAAFWVGFLLGSLRLPFFVSLLPLAWTRGKGIWHHPVRQDELMVLPAPRLAGALRGDLDRDEGEGLLGARLVAANAFQRWAAQRSLRHYLGQNRARALPLIYDILASSHLDEYILEPLSQKQARLFPSTRRVLLAELAGQFIDASGFRSSEWLAWSLTLPLRERSVTPLSQFAAMLYDLLDQETVEAGGFNLAAYRDVCAGVQDYVHGSEVYRSFETMSAFLACWQVEDLAGAEAGLAWLDALPEPPLRPTVLEALRRLGRVGAEIEVYCQSTGRVNQLAALARATDALDDLDEYVVAEVMVPEQTILRRIIRRWRRLVSEAGGEVGRVEDVGPVVNPYVAGNPVTGDLFVGREDILRRLEELWAKEGACPSVVIYGHRRMGKSSILHNLGVRFGARTSVVDFNMQRAGLVSSSGELLYSLALALHDAQTSEVSASGPEATSEVSLAEPDEERFTAHNPYTAFDRFLKQRDRVRGDRRFIVTVDEFELIEALIAEGQLEPRLLDFWRGLIQTYPWFVVAFAGLHTLEEMRRDYWNPLFGSVTAVPVSFLSHRAAWQLITQPSPDFSLDYDTDAVEHIIALTHGQPYLIQLIGHGLVTRFNRQTFEEGVERERRFTLADVEAVIGAPEFYRDGDAYFTGVWRQAEASPPPGQTAVLRALACSEAGTPIGDCADQAGLAPEEVSGALDTLKRHDVAMDADGRWRFTVELMRRWVAESRPRTKAQS
jgi:hypothetical protein